MGIGVGISFLNTVRFSGFGQIFWSFKLDVYRG